MHRVPAIDIDDVIELINEFSTATRAEAGESEAPYPRLGLLTRFTGSRAETVQIADRLFSVLAEQATEALDDLNELAGAAGIVHRLDPEGHLTWYRAEGTSPLTTALVAAVVNFIDTTGLAHIGLCSADRCVDLYADRSRGNRRQYCSDRCSARHRVAAWRTRQQLAKSN